MKIRLLLLCFCALLLCGCPTFFFKNDMGVHRITNQHLPRISKSQIYDVLKKEFPNHTVEFLDMPERIGFGGSLPNFGNNAIEFQNHPFMFGGITLGNTISYASSMPPNSVVNGQIVGEHEGAHTIQGQWLGPLYFPAHIIGGTISLIGTSFTPSNQINFSRWHDLNFMERGPLHNPPRPF